MSQAGFGPFLSPLFSQPPMVSTRFKIFMEDTLSSLRTRMLWSHLGVRNVLVEAAKRLLAGLPSHAGRSRAGAFL